MLAAASKPAARSQPAGNGRHGKAHAIRAEAVTLKKVEQRNRTYCVQLQNRCRLFDLERGALRASYSKKKLSFKKRIEDYEKRLTELKDLKLDPSAPTFLTEQQPARDAAAAAADAEAAFRRQLAGGGISLDLDAVGSIRRQTKPTNGGLVIGRALLGLQRLQRKHLSDYERAAGALRRLEQEVGVSLDAGLPRRSYTPPDAADAERLAAARSSTFLAYQHGQIRAKERELKQLGLRTAAAGAAADRLERARPQTAPPPSSTEPVVATAIAANKKPAAVASQDDAKNLVRLFCKRVDTPKEGTAKAAATGGVAATSAAPIAPARGANRSATVRTPVKRALNGQTITLVSYNHYADIIKNPFDDGVIPEVTRSRLLIQAQKDERMYVWLGFTSNEEMMKALHSKDGKIKQIPAALLHVLEDAAQDDSAEVLDNMVESESEASTDDEDARFKIFDNNKVLGRKAKVKPKHTV